MNAPFDRNAEVRRLFGERLDDHQIAAALGITKNAVIGIRWRLGLRVAAKPVSVAPAGRPERKAVAAQQPRPKPISIVPAAAPLVAHELPPQINGSPILITGLRLGVCHWPLWPHDTRPDPDEAFYCGAPSDCTDVYCPSHRALSNASGSSSRGRARPDQRMRLLKRIGIDARFVGVES